MALRGLVTDDGRPARPRPRTPSGPARAACARASWRSSSARPGPASSSGSCSSRPAGAACPPTTCCSRGRRASARPAWPRSWPPSSGSASGSPPAGPGAGRRPGRHPHRPGAERRAVRGRDPPSPPGGRGGPLPGHGGLPDRRRSARARGAQPTPGPAALHPGRGHHPHRADHLAAARPLRLLGPARLLRPGRPPGHRHPFGGHPRGGHRCRRGRGPGPAVPGTPGSPTGCCAGSATTPRSGPTGRWTSRGRGRPGAVRGRPPRPGQARPGPAAGAVRALRGAPVGLATLAVSVGEEQDTVEDVAEPFLLQLGFLQRTPRAVATAAAFAHLGPACPGAPAPGPLPAPCSKGTRSRIAAASAPSEVLNPWKVAGRSSSSC